MFRRSDAIHEYSPSSIARTPSMGSMESRRQTRAAEIPNARPIAAVAMAPETPFDRRLPNVAFSRNPANGRRGISASKTSPFERRERIRAERLAMPEERDDDGQPDRRLGGR